MISQTESDLTLGHVEELEVVSRKNDNSSSLVKYLEYFSGQSFNFLVIFFAIKVVWSCLMYHQETKLVSIPYHNFSYQYKQCTEEEHVSGSKIQRTLSDAVQYKLCIPVL